MYDIFVGFIEFEEANCEGDPVPRVMDIVVNAGGSDQEIVGLNLADETGECALAAYMTKVQVAPTVKTIQVTIKKNAASAAEAVLSFLKIRPSTTRRLNANCWKGDKFEESDVQAS